MKNADYDFISLKPVKHKYKNNKLTQDGVICMANHVKRGLQNEMGAKLHIDVKRTPSNYSLHGPSKPSEISNYVNIQLAKAGIKLQKNNVILISVIFGLPVSWFSKNTRKYFEDCYQWVLHRFNCELITFDVHLDESAPHAHALLLPIVKDKKNGEMKMGGSQIMGGIPQIYAYRDSFFKEVAINHGLIHSKKKLTGTHKIELAETLIKKATSQKDPFFQSVFFQVIRDKLYQDPESFALAIGVPFE